MFNWQQFSLPREKQINKILIKTIINDFLWKPKLGGKE